MMPCKGNIKNRPALLTGRDGRSQRIRFRFSFLKKSSVNNFFYLSVAKIRTFFESTKQLFENL